MKSKKNLFLLILAGLTALVILQNTAKVETDLLVFDLGVPPVYLTLLLGVLIGFILGKPKKKKT